MSESESKSLNDRMVDVRNELIVQGANAYLLARKTLLIGVGLVALGMDEAGAVAERAAERGEIVESDTQSTLSDIRSRLQRRADTADEKRVEVTENARVALEDSVETIRKQFNGGPAN